MLRSVLRTHAAAGYSATRALITTASRVSASSRKSSETATPATQATRSPARDHGQPVAQRARDLAIGEQVLQRLRSLHAEWADPVAVAPRAHDELGPERGGVERRELGAPGLDRAGANVGADLPAAEAAMPRDTQPHGLGLGAVGHREADQCRARRPPADRRRARSPRPRAPGRGARSARPSRRPIGTWRTATRSARMRSAMRRSAGSAPASASAGIADTPLPGPAVGEQLGCQPLEQAGLLGELGPGLGHVALHPRG